LQEDKTGKEARASISNLYLIAKFKESVRNALFYFVNKTPFTGNGFFKAFRQTIWFNGLSNSKNTW